MWHARDFVYSICWFWFKPARKPLQEQKPMTEVFLFLLNSIVIKEAFVFFVVEHISPLWEVIWKWKYYFSRWLNAQHGYWNVTDLSLNVFLNSFFCVCVWYRSLRCLYMQDESKRNDLFLYNIHANIVCRIKKQQSGI